MFHRRFIFPFLFFVGPFASHPALAETKPVGDATYASELIQKAHEMKLSEDRYWRILVHYRPRWLSGVKSEIQAKEFFNAHDGRTNPAGELDETIKTFFTPRSQCVFRDRYFWLRRKLHFDPKRLPEESCPDYEFWKEALDPESVTLVFSSYFMNNPASTFGHTLLRLNHRKHSSGERLLDYGVNYSASVETGNALLYAFLGMTGGFNGVFSNVPYFMKVSEYNDSENRDLWEYDLHFTQEQLDQMMAHLWSVGHFSTPYYFFDENCSFMILSILDAADPELRLADQFNSSWWVIPADTVRAVASRKDLVQKVSVRPSLAYRIKKQRGELSSSEDRLFLRIIGNPRSDAFVEIKNQKNPARLLDLISDYLRFLKFKRKNQLSPDYVSLQSRTLIARSELSDPPAEISLSAEEFSQQRPDAGHDTARVDLAGGYNGLTGSYIELGTRPAFHDLNASTLGYPPDAQIEILDINGRYSPTSKLLRFERVTLLDILSVNSWDRVFKRFAWSLHLGANPVRDFNCEDCLEYRTDVGAGVAIRPAAPVLLYALGKAELGFGAQYGPGYRLGPGSETGLLISVSDQLSLQLGGSYHHPLLGYTPDYFQASAEARISTSKDTEIRFGYNSYRISNEAKAGIYVYF